MNYYNLFRQGIYIQGYFYSRIFYSSFKSSDYSDKLKDILNCNDVPLCYKFVSFFGDYTFLDVRSGRSFSFDVSIYDFFDEKPFFYLSRDDKRYLFIPFDLGSITYSFWSAYDSDGNESLLMVAVYVYFKASVFCCSLDNEILYSIKELLGG